MTVIELVCVRNVLIYACHAYLLPSSECAILFAVSYSFYLQIIHFDVDLHWKKGKGKSQSRDLLNFMYRYCVVCHLSPSTCITDVWGFDTAAVTVLRNMEAPDSDKRLISKYAVLLSNSSELLRETTINVSDINRNLRISSQFH